MHALSLRSGVKRVGEAIGEGAVVESGSSHTALATIQTAMERERAVSIAQFITKRDRKPPLLPLSVQRNHSQTR